MIELFVFFVPVQELWNQILHIRLVICDIIEQCQANMLPIKIGVIIANNATLSQM